MDNVVDEVEGYFVERKIGVLDLFRENDVPIAAFACERSRLVGAHNKLPKLKRFCRDAFVKWLDKGDFVEKPIGSGGVSDVLDRKSVV